MLATGTKAPDFKLFDNNEIEVSLSDFKGKWIILYFYPRDNTSGCTKEACDFTDATEEFGNIDTIVLGVSPDSVPSHQKFISIHNLKIKLLSDPEKNIIKSYEAWGIKKLYGKESEGLIRSTYIIDPDGKIAASWTNVKVRQKSKTGETKHVDKVKEKLIDLQHN